MLAAGKGAASLSAQRIWFRQLSLAAQSDTILPLITPWSNSASSVKLSAEWHAQEPSCLSGHETWTEAAPSVPVAAHSPHRAACLRRLGFLPRLREAQPRTLYELTPTRCQVSEKNKEEQRV